MAHKAVETGSEVRMRPCLDCGVIVETKRDSKTGARCWRCRDIRKYDYPPQRGERLNGLSPSARGYDSRWNRLSKQARREQPFCSDCGSPEDLTADHLRWPARSLEDVDVLCRPCNSAKGAIR